MSEYTPNLGLFKYNLNIDGKIVFDITKALNSNWDKLDSIIQNIFDRLYPIGQPIFRLNNDIYENEVCLDGSYKLISEYPLLYDVYGNYYGEPLEGYFKLPDFTNRCLWGVNEFHFDTTFNPYIEAGLPDHSHKIPVTNTCCGADPAGTKSTRNWSNGDYAWTGVSKMDVENASDFNPIYGNSETVQPPAIKVRVVTRYK